MIDRMASKFIKNLGFDTRERTDEIKLEKYLSIEKPKWNKT